MADAYLLGPPAASTAPTANLLTFVTAFYSSMERERERDAITCEIAKSPVHVDRDIRT